MYGIIILTENDLKRMSVFEFEKPLKEKHIALKVITKYDWDNTHTCIENGYGDFFAFSLYREDCARQSIRHKELQKIFGKNVEINKTFNYTIWNCSGNITILNGLFEVKNWKDTIPKEDLNLIKKATENFSRGLVCCSDCKKELEIMREVAGHYFAGSFCKDCWFGIGGKHINDGGWKRIEAQENYN